jgi:tyrosyl-tRNA synthetase
MNVFDCLEKRGFIAQATSPDLKKLLTNPLSFYIGFDPTADSLHLGHLVGIMAIAWLRKFGHKAYALVGGATGRIGDPSGKSIERPFLEDKIIESNVVAIQKLLEKILSRSSVKGLDSIVYLNNNDWLSQFSFIDFLRDVGKHFRLSSMLSKESVRLRLESEEGMSFTEFTYQMLQAYDFYHLSKHYGITLQLGGMDQWGNITAGIELGRRLASLPLYGLTFPLLTRSDGKKFGKSEGGAVWLSEEKLSAYQFYQYLMGIPDADVCRMMALLTFMEMEEIQEIQHQMALANYVPNSAQKRLAFEVTRFIHGEEGVQTAQRVTDAASPGSLTSLDKESLERVAKDMPNVSLPAPQVLGQRFVDVAALMGWVDSKSEATRLVKNGGAYLNNIRIDDPFYCFDSSQLIDKTFFLVAIGKKKKILVRILF